MTRIGIEQASSHLAELIARVANGERILITDRDKPVGLLSAPPSDAEMPDIGTPEWNRLNHRRAELIRKEVDGSITETEHQELNILQRDTLAAVNAAYPRELPDTDTLHRLRSQLESEHRDDPE